MQCMSAVQCTLCAFQHVYVVLGSTTPLLWIHLPALLAVMAWQGLHCLLPQLV
jgi:hypothetical protein